MQNTISKCYFKVVPAAIIIYQNIIEKTMAITLNDFKVDGALRRFVTKTGLLDKVDAGTADDTILEALYLAVTNVGTFIDSDNNGIITKDDAVSPEYSNGGETPGDEDKYYALYNLNDEETMIDCGECTVFDSESNPDYKQFLVTKTHAKDDFSSGDMYLVSKEDYESGAPFLDVTTLDGQKLDLMIKFGDEDFYHDDEEEETIHVYVAFYDAYQDRILAQDSCDIKPGAWEDGYCRISGVTCNYFGNLFERGLYIQETEGNFAYNNMYTAYNSDYKETGFYVTLSESEYSVPTYPTRYFKMWSNSNQQLAYKGTVNVLETNVNDYDILQVIQYETMNSGYDTILFKRYSVQSNNEDDKEFDLRDYGSEYSNGYSIKFYSSYPSDDEEEGGETDPWEGYDKRWFALYSTDSDSAIQYSGQLAVIEEEHDGKWDLFKIISCDNDSEMNGQDIVIYHDENALERYDEFITCGGYGDLYQGYIKFFEDEQSRVIVNGEDTPDEPEETRTDASWLPVKDESTWNTAYDNGNGVLGAYYNVYPTEDLWNSVEERPAVFDDKVYEGGIYSDVAGTELMEQRSLKAGWVSNSVQSMSTEKDVYYTPMFYEVDGETVYELFTDEDMKESSGIYFKPTSFSYPDCIHCWDGSFSAPGAQYPWVAIEMPEPFYGYIEMTYDDLEGTYYPFGQESREFRNGFAVVSVPETFNYPDFKITTRGGSAVKNFAKTKCHVTLVAPNNTPAVTEG